MTQTEKAELYDELVRQGDQVQREISKLKSTNINGNNPKENARLAELAQKMARLEQRMDQLLGQG